MSEESRFKLQCHGPEILDSIKDDKSLRLLNSIAKGEESDTERSFDPT